VNNHISGITVREYMYLGVFIIYAIYKDHKCNYCVLWYSCCLQI